MFKKCSKVVEVAVKQNPKAVRFASESLREDNSLKQKHSVERGFRRMVVKDV